MDRSSPTEIHTVTDREREILERVARGLSFKESARELGIAPRTVERHVENLRNKLGAHNTTHLVAKAVANGLV